MVRVELEEGMGIIGSCLGVGSRAGIGGRIGFTTGEGAVEGERSEWYERLILAALRFGLSYRFFSNVVTVNDAYLVCNTGARGVVFWDMRGGEFVVEE